MIISIPRFWHLFTRNDNMIINKWAIDHKNWYSFVVSLIVIQILCITCCNLIFCFILFNLQITNLVSFLNNWLEKCRKFVYWWTLLWYLAIQVCFDICQHGVCVWGLGVGGRCKIILNYRKCVLLTWNEYPYIYIYFWIIYIKWELKVRKCMKKNSIYNTINNIWMNLISFDHENKHPN